MKQLFLCTALSFASIIVSGQCDFTTVVITTNTVDWGEEVGWELFNDADLLLGDFQADANDSEYVNEFCLEDGCYLLHATDTYGDGWNGGSVSIDTGDEVYAYALLTSTEGYFAFGVNTEGCIIEIPGCTDPEASNYNPLANVDDGSCMSIAEVLDMQSITWLIQSGPTSNRINWAIQNRGNENPNDEFEDEEEFVQMLTDSILPPFTLGADLEKEPYARYRNFFNLQAWWWPDAPYTETGWNWDLLKGMRDAYFLPWDDDEHGWATLFSISKFGGGGGAGVQPDTRTGDGYMFGTGWETLLHEFGHTMPQVPDEYTASGEWSGGQCWEGANTSGFIVKDSIPWRNWIEEDTELPTPYTGENLNKIGAFEGALTNYFGCHRPTARACYMGAGGFGPEFGTDMCAPCRQRVICHLYKYVDVIENPSPEASDLTLSSGETWTFSADIIKPEPNTQAYTWTSNGMEISTGEEATITFGNCLTYEVTLTVRDTTSWVRYDAGFDHIYPEPVETFTWTITISDATSSGIQSELDIQNVGCTGGLTGQIQFEGSGGTAPYTAFYDGMEYSGGIDGLGPGAYNFWVVDSNGCGVSESAEVSASPLLLTDVCAEYNGSAWDVHASVEGYPEDEINFNWNPIAEGPDLVNVPDGSYELIASWQGDEACVVTYPFELSSPVAALEASYEAFACAYPNGEVNLDNANGRIDLDISGGTPAYEINWSLNAAADQTQPEASAIEASGSNFDHFPEYAFDNSENTKWLHFVSENAWIAQEFELPFAVKYYTVMSGDDVPGRDPKDWVFEGSNDGENWTIIDSRTDEDFPQRRQRKLYTVSNEEAYTWYRFYVLENSGDDSIQLQELEFVGIDPDGAFSALPQYDGMYSLTGLIPGDYHYEVKDGNAQCAKDTVLICAADAFIVQDLHVIQESLCAVMVENPDADLDYYWLSDEAGSEVLGTGTSFSPTQEGNYWLAAADPETGAFSGNRPGFAVTMPDQPEVEEVSDGVLGIIDANPDYIYRWYTEDCGGVPVSEGESFEPGSSAVTYYVASFWADPFPDPIDPAVVDGLMIRMDAADLDGDGLVDSPGPVSSSLYDWTFTPSNGWADWFAYRGNAQNGLGIADFATIWLQSIEENFNGYRTVVMAYRENLLTFPGHAPFEGLSQYMPYSGTPEVSLFEDDLPTETLNGSTWLNGEEVDPLTTPNPMDFCVLGQRLASVGNATINYTDTHWEGAVGEILFYDEVLSDEDMTGISEFLRRKWISTADLESPRTVVVWDGMNIGIDEETTIPERRMLIYPNPSSGEASIQLESPTDANTTLTIYHINGQKVLAKTLANELRLISLTEHIHGLAAGSYLVHIQSEGKAALVERFILK